MPTMQMAKKAWSMKKHWQQMELLPSAVTSHEININPVIS